VARLFADARTALVASQLSTLEGRPRSRLRLTTTEWNAREDALVGAFAQEAVVDSANPFRSVPVDSLSRLGFVAQELDGSTVWRAPDAAVLTDDRFLAEYCLHLVDDSLATPDRIGVGFRPARTRRDITQIEGVLWLDRRSSALQRLEFSYVGLDYLARDAAPGGWVDYARLPDGTWLLHHWGLRVPKIARRVTLRRGTVIGGRSLTGISELVGEVLEVSVGTRRQYTVGATDWVGESGGGNTTPRRPTVRGADGALLPKASVRASTTRRSPGGTQARASVATVTDSAGAYALCDVPTDELLQLAFDAEGHAADSVSVIVSASRGISLVDWQLRGAAPVTLESLRAIDIEAGASLLVDSIPVGPRSTTALTAGTVPVDRSPARLLRVQAVTGEPLHAAIVRLPDGRASTTDSLGEVLLPDSTALELPVQVQRIGYRPFLGTTTRATSGVPFVIELANAVPVRWGTAPAGGAIVRVVDADSIPIPYALVHLDGRPARATDQRGMVVLPSDSRLALRARVQRIGYAPFDGNLSRADTTASFVVTLSSIAPTLDAVRTVAPRETVLSRTGFYDRMQRVRAGAFVAEFIAPEELELRAVGRISNVLAGKPYVTVNRGQLLGRGGCRMQILLDGKLMEGNAPDDFIGTNEVMAIEIYPSTANAPSELIPLTERGSCGIVAFWTGPRR
jgi:hypothetical protein